MILDAKVPEGSLGLKWSTHKFNLKLINPVNRRKYDIIVVGTGLAGASAAATLGELGYNVTAFCLQDSPRRAHSIAAQGGINAAKNYQNDGDSIYRLFYDTIRGGDYRAREANVFRLAEISLNIIDQCVAQGVPFAREYGGLLANRSFGGTQVSRTFYARGQTGQQLLLGAYGALNRQIAKGNVKMHVRTEMLDLVVEEGKARGIVTRDLVTGKIGAHSAHAVLLCTGGYANVFYLSTNAKGSNVTASWRAHKKGALFANPCFTQIHPTCIPVSGHSQSKLTLMSESLRNDARIWVPKTASPGLKGKDAANVPDWERDYFLERKYPSFGNLVPRDVASRSAKNVCDDGRGAGVTGLAVFLDFYDALKREGKEAIAAKYSNLFELYHHITGDNPYEMPMMIFPAAHYAMGGLWVDYNLMTSISGLYALGEANFSDHGANRLGASALMQGLADGYFVIPNTVGDYLANIGWNDKWDIGHPAFKDAVIAARMRLERLLTIKGKKTVDEFHRSLGLTLWDHCGISRSEKGLKNAKIMIQEIKADFWKNLNVTGGLNELNQELEKAGRVADFIELGELMVDDALNRAESCGVHFREEYQTSEGEALRNDSRFSYVAAWEYKGFGDSEILHRERLSFENIQLEQRNYK
ncbi:MAG: fumarate reductase/succinate dehydrogenase flavoprotein subunit [Proteobacteria bacterium]|nr:fumarate reductase/succinate dehydrogenase flavoprotein subunit [Pseudomonadota bacterium]